MVEPLWASATVDGSLKLRVVDDLRVLTLRHLPGGAAAVEAALSDHRLLPLPKPGECRGNDPWLLWTGPTECLLLSSGDRLVDDVLQALAPGRENLACALDRSAGCRVFDLRGSDVVEWLARLLDAGAMPQRAGQGHRARWMDIGVVLVRIAPQRVLLVADRMHGEHVAQWLAHAPPWRALAGGTAGPG